MLIYLTIPLFALVRSSDLSSTDSEPNRKINHLNKGPSTEFETLLAAIEANDPDRISEILYPVEFVETIELTRPELLTDAVVLTLEKDLDKAFIVLIEDGGFNYRPLLKIEEYDCPKIKRLLRHIPIIDLIDGTIRIEDIDIEQLEDVQVDLLKALLYETPSEKIWDEQIRRAQGDKDQEFLHGLDDEVGNLLVIWEIRRTVELLHTLNDVLVDRKFTSEVAKKVSQLIAGKMIDAEEENRMRMVIPEKYPASDKEPQIIMEMNKTIPSTPVENVSNPSYTVLNTPTTESTAQWPPLAPIIARHPIFFAFIFLLFAYYSL